MCVCSIYCSTSILIAFLMSSIDVQTETSIVMLSMYMLMLILAISWSYFHCDCDGIANLLCTDLVQACIICTHCICEYVALCVVAAVTGLDVFVDHCHHWFVVCYYICFLGEIVVVEFLQTM